MFDFQRLATAATDLDSRLEQIANQSRLTNALLALSIRVQSGSWTLSISEMADLDRLIVDILPISKQPFAPTGLEDE
jgi:hypothetical protein